MTMINKQQLATPSIFTPGEAKVQIAGVIFTEAMTEMKNILSHAEDRYDGDTKSRGYLFYKSFIMDQVYSMLERQFDVMKQQGLIVECGCGANIYKNRSGYKPCVRCCGSGFTNSPAYNNFLYSLEDKTVR